MREVVLVFAACTAACLLGHLGILRSVVRSRVVTADANVPRPRLAIEIVWAVIPAVALAALLIFTWPHVLQHLRSMPGVLLRVAQ
jgi:hypothetical protein